MAAAKTIMKRKISCISISRKQQAKKKHGTLAYHARINNGKNSGSSHQRKAASISSKARGVNISVISSIA